MKMNLIIRRIPFYFSLFLIFYCLFFFIHRVQAVNANVNLNTTVLPYISMTITQNDTINFGNITPLEATAGSGGTEISVSTSASNGYDLLVGDGSNANSALVHSDLSTYIADYAGTIASPTSWSGNGLGLSVYSASNKDGKWGSGTTYSDSSNKYAGIPQNATTIMSKNTYSESADKTYVGWKLNVPNDQKTGNYTGTVTFTATAHAD